MKENNKTVTVAEKTAPITDSAIRVKVIYPENVSDSIRREKINRIYDILSKHKAV